MAVLRKNKRFGLLAYNTSKRMIDLIIQYSNQGSKTRTTRAQVIMHLGDCSADTLQVVAMCSIAYEKCCHIDWGAWEYLSSTHRNNYVPYCKPNIQTRLELPRVWLHSIGADDEIYSSRAALPEPVVKEATEADD